MPEVLISMQNLEQTYLQGNVPVQVLDKIGGLVFSGDRIALTGPSGSGKSTLLQLMAGLDEPSGGTIHWPGLGGRKGLGPGHVGLVFQTTSLVAPLSVVENVELPMLLAGEDLSRARASAMGALETLKLEALADKLPEELSGGQAQRVAVARALSSRPKLLLADEPTGQLDRTTAGHLISCLLDALTSTGAALIVATHDLAIARRMKTQWHLRHGRLEIKRCSSIDG